MLFKQLEQLTVFFVVRKYEKNAWLREINLKKVRCLKNSHIGDILQFI